MTEVKRYQTDDYPMIEFVDVEDYDTLSTQNEELRKQLATAQQERDALIDAIDCACNALTDSINASGNDADTNMHWVRKLRTFITNDTVKP